MKPKLCTYAERYERLCDPKCCLLLASQCYFMVALWNRETIYIFILFLLLLFLLVSLVSGHSSELLCLALERCIAK